VFVSIFFILFLAVLWLLYIVLPKQWRKAVLLSFSYVFCGYISVKALIAVAVSTLITFGGAKAIEKKRNNEANNQARIIALFVIAMFATVLIVVKNIPYALGVAGVNGNGWLGSIVLPVGFSFYAFQAIGYIYDVYTGKDQAENDLISFALYMGFFAKLVSGPIERKGNFAKQLAKLTDVVIFDWNRLSLGITYMVWGYFLKMVVADRLALIVNEIHSASELFDAVWLILGAVMYSFQVYTDFAGYTFIAIGSAYLFGIELVQNFASPYCSKSITEFWKRWHISLSSWLKDYVYIPLGGNRKGKLRKNLNTLIVFLLCGIWHGNGMSFVVWGLLHGIYSIFDSSFGKKYTAEHGIEAAIRRLFTFMAVTVAWIFFRADSLANACNYIVGIITNGINIRGAISVLESNGVELIQVIIAVAVIVLVQVVDRISYSKATPLPELVQNNRLLKYALIYCCLMAIFVFGIYGGDFKAENFIYMRF